MAAFRRRNSRVILFAVFALMVFFYLQLSSISSKLPARRFKPSSFDWSTVETFFPPKDIKPLPQGQPKRLPPVQAPRTAFTNPDTPDPRRDEVLQVFKRSYNAYREHAWLRDELLPVSGGFKNPFGGWGATLIDALDTLWIMGLKEEFEEATTAVAALDWSKTREGAANMFETTIRYLGGLISAYELSGDEDMLSKAIELGEMLYVGFDTPNRMPGFWLNFREARKGRQVAGYHDASASPASMCLEFTRLSQITGDPKWYDATDRVTRFLERVQEDTKLPGMWPMNIDFRDEEATSNMFTIGANADSLYEYLPKMHALLGGVDETYARMYRRAMDTITKNLIFRPMLPNGEDILFAGDVRLGRSGVSLVPEGQHLTCFAGGMFGLGAKLLAIPEHLSIGERLARGCGWAYGQFPTGLMPEIFNLFPCESMDGCEWDEAKWKAEGDPLLPKGWQRIRDSRYILRPEAIESIFLLYRMTGKDDLRDLAWEMFESIVRSTKTDLAYSAIKSVEVEETIKMDSMESFWLAETLKYFYLIFSPPDLISLDEYVLNTEAHPFRRPG